MEGDQLGEVLEYADDFGPVQPRRPRIDCAQRAEEGAVLKNDRHRDVALKPVHSWRMMIAEMFVLSDVIDNDGSAAITNFVADPPGRSPKAISSRTAQATQRSFVTLAT